MRPLASLSPSRLEGQSQRSAQHPVPPFLKLSVDLFKCILLENLELHDQFILGQVCSSARTITARPWKSVVAKLPRDGRTQFFHGISHTLPFHYVCAPCGGLHEAEGNDLPVCWLPPWRRRDQETDQVLERKPPPCGKRPVLVGESYWPQSQPYYIRDKHIQMALKLHRLGKVDNAYFRGLMARSSGHGSGRRIYDLEYTYSAEPRIVAERFMVHTEWKISHPEGGLSWARHELELYGFCWHLWLYKNDWDPWGDLTLEERLHCYPNEARSILSDWVRREQLRKLVVDADRALSPRMRNQEVTGHCMQCLTDYSIRVGPGDEIILRGWYD